MTRQSLRFAIRRVRIALVLLTERRALLYVLIDTALILAAVGEGFTANGKADEFYIVLYILPLFLLAVPMMSEAVAMERRAGTLDLALTSPARRSTSSGASPRLRC